MAWPQNASAWQTLTPAEWNAGAEALASVKGQTALVLGVQTTGFNIANSQTYAKKAKSLNADGIISLVPPGASDADAIAYFKALSDASGLPILVQAVGAVSVDSLVALAAAVPAIVAVKDEAGDPLERAPGLLQRTGGKLEDFSGGGGMTFFPEMELGFVAPVPIPVSPMCCRPASIPTRRAASARPMTHSAGSSPSIRCRMPMSM